VPSLNDVAQRHTELTEADLERLHLLLSDWQLLADLAFSDLVLWLPTWNGSGYVAGAQMRPTTGSTVFGDDLVGTFLPKGRRPLLDEALELGRVVRSRTELALAPAQALPVRGPDGRVVAVVARHADPATTRTSGRLEAAYLELAERLGEMVAEGAFPFPGGLEGLDSSPRVGDGLVRLDTDGTVSYASPNALSAYRRLGLAADLVGHRLDTVTRQLVPRRGPVDEDLAAVAGGRTARGVEVEGKGTTVQLRAIPLLQRGARVGGLVLVRDVTELRRRERELLTKDATIREIHHRVKNNLQTVAALLRLQARRLDVPEGRSALEEAVRRVGSIALVHELLSTAPEESVPFDEVADRVLSMVAELSSQGPARAVAGSGAGPAGIVRPVRTGSFGDVRAEVATPLAVVLSELVQNAVEHGLDGGPGLLEVRAERVGGVLRVEVLDDGVGLPVGFDLASSDRLGLQIVRTLVEGELGGTLLLDHRQSGGTRAVVEVPLAA
jgi:two-component sensor histidine kinase